MKTKGVKHNFILFDDQSIALMSLALDGQKVLVVHEEHIDLGGMSDEQASQKIKTFLKSKGLKGDPWVPVVASNKILFKTIDVPSIHASEISQMIGWHIQTLWDTEQNLRWDYKVVAVNNNQSKVLAIGIDQVVLAKYWNILKDSAVRFSVFSVRCFMMLSWLEDQDSSLPNNYAVLWADSHHFEFYVVNNGCLIGTRTFVCRDQIVADDHARLLAEQFIFYLRMRGEQSEIELDKLFLIGAKERVEAIHTYLNRDLKTISQIIAVESRAVVGSSVPTFNWVPDHVHVLRQRKENLYQWGMFIVLSLLLIGFTTSFAAIRYYKDGLFLNQLRKEEQDSQRKADALLRLKQQADMMVLKDNQRNLVARWLEILDATRPATVYLSKLEWQFSTGLILHGFASDEAQVNSWQKDLASSHIFEDVILQSTQRQGQGDGALVSFKIKCLLKGNEQK